MKYYHYFNEIFQLLSIVFFYFFIYYGIIEKSLRASGEPMVNTLEDNIFNDLVYIYNTATAENLIHEIIIRIQHLKESIHRSHRQDYIDEKDSILITYGDICQSPGKTPLSSLAAFLNQFVGDEISTIHILPFYPYSSDDGFSVIDYLQVNPELGTWENIKSIGTHYRLMFDLVANHVSRKSIWFKEYLQGVPEKSGYFIEMTDIPDLAKVFRPRALPLLTPVGTGDNPRKVWTTFSEDQIDLNYANPAVLLEILDVLSRYVLEGAEFIRLDAIAFIWKEIGTSCIHHPKTHRIIQLMRKFLEAAGANVTIITETNVPHKDNISYFGNGYNEAAMVYNFPLPPLTLHAFMSEDATILTTWASSLEFPSDKVTYFNFLASHDGIGVNPVKGILSHADIDWIANRIQALGGYVSKKNNPDGTTSPYELNCNFLSALASGPDEKISIELEAARFIASQSIMLALRGVPGIYFHSLVGSKNWVEGPRITGMARSINREKLPLDYLVTVLTDKKSLQYNIFNKYRHMLSVRTKNKAFCPSSEQEILFLHDSVFAVLRTSGNRSTAVFCLTNVSSKYVSVKILPENDEIETLTDLLSGKIFKVKNRDPLSIDLDPYEILWLKESSK